MATRFHRTHTRFPRILAFAVATMLACGGSARAHSHANASLATKSTSAALNRVLISDMSEPSEKLPQGVPSWYDWAGHPRVRPVRSPHKFKAFTAWGQLYQCAGTSAARGETVQLRDMQAWALPSIDSWQQLQASSELQGAAFAEDYAGPTVPAHYIAKASGTAVTPVARHNFHFWPSSGRVGLRPAQIAASDRRRAGAVADASLRIGPGLLVSERGRRPLALGWAPSPAADNSADVGIGRFKRVERRWRLFTMTTASDAALDRAPLPDIAPANETF